MAALKWDRKENAVEMVETSMEQDVAAVLAASKEKRGAAKENAALFFCINDKEDKECVNNYDDGNPTDKSEESEDDGNVAVARQSTKQGGHGADDTGWISRTAGRNVKFK